MADCSKTEVFLAEWERMCDCTECNLCDFGELDDVEILPCDVIAKEHTKEAVAIIQKWSDSHPAPKPKTYADVFFEKFPNAPRTKHGTPMCCWSHVYADGHCDYDAEYSEIHACRECWNEPYKESEE